MSDEMVGRQETSGREGLLDCRRARLVPATVMKLTDYTYTIIRLLSHLDLRRQYY